MDEIEIWCGQSCNRLYVGKVITIFHDDRVRLMSEWLDGSKHDVTVEIEPGSLERTCAGYCALIREPE